MKYFIILIMTLGLSACGVSIDDHSTNAFQLRKMSDKEKYIYDSANRQSSISLSRRNSVVGIGQADLIAEEKKEQEDNLEYALKQVSDNYDPRKIGTVNKSRPYICGKVVMMETSGSPMTGYTSRPYDIPVDCYTDPGEAWHKQTRIYEQKRAETIKALERHSAQRMDALKADMEYTKHLEDYNISIQSKLMDLIANPTPEEHLNQQQIDELAEFFEKFQSGNYGINRDDFVFYIARMLPVPQFDEWMKNRN